MTKIIVFRKALDCKQLTEFLRTKLLRPYWQRTGWDYYIIGHSSGDTISFTRSGPEFDGQYAEVEPESPNVIKVVGEGPVKLIKNLLRSYEGRSEVLIEIM